MQKRVSFLPFFLVFFTLSVLTIIVGRLGILDGFSSVFNSSSNSIRSASVDIFGLKGAQSKEVKKIIGENLKLQKELSDKKNLLSENKALRDQFDSSGSNSQSMIPTRVVGSPGFIPGITLPEYLILDKGKSDKIREGDSVVIGNYLVGKIVKTTDKNSKVELVVNKNSSFTAKVENSDISGVLIGKGNGEMVLDNVLLTQNLKKDSQILTKGNKNEKGEGYPPDVVVGKIISIEKKSSDLFQRAKVQSPIDFKNLEYVFVLK